MHIVKAQSIDVAPKTTLTLPRHTKFLSVNLDHRFNNVQIWMLQNTADDVKTEKVDVITVRAEEPLNPPNASYLGQLKDSAGWLHVFAIRESEKLPFQK